MPSARGRPGEPAEDPQKTSPLVLLHVAPYGGAVVTNFLSGRKWAFSRDRFEGCGIDLWVWLAPYCACVEELEVEEEKR